MRQGPVRPKKSWDNPTNAALLHLVTIKRAAAVCMNVATTPFHSEINPWKDTERPNTYIEDFGTSKTHYHKGTAITNALAYSSLLTVRL